MSNDGKGEEYSKIKNLFDEQTRTVIGLVYDDDDHHHVTLPARIYLILSPHVSIVHRSR